MVRKVLVVDDSELNRKILGQILKEDYEILEAENGARALEALSREPDKISAVLLDIIMPEMDGYEALTRMRANPLLKPIPVLVTTGNTDTGAEVKALSLGANDYITKPYNPAVIRHRLWNTINFRETAAFVNAATKDKLTGLYNRETFFEKAAELIDARPAGEYALVCFDIDNFKVINDQFGSTVGDDVLKHVAGALREGFERVGGILSRVMADNFAALCPREFMDAEAFAQTLERAEIIGEDMRRVTISVGCYVVSDTSLPISAMYDRAVIAQASVKGRFDALVGYYDERMRESMLINQEIVNDMNAALTGEQFEVWLQPQYNHASGALIGAEALVRWRHPAKGLVSPGLFIPVFENNGFIYELDKYIWEKVCKLLRRWLDTGQAPLPISVNLSRYDVLRDDIVDVLTSLITKYRVPVELLRLEITESAFAKSTERIIQVVKQLMSFGFTMEIDDFGSGYSSLNTLKDVPCDVLKLDMRFLEGNDNSSRGGNILESIVRMTKWLGITVIAEGVETRAQADYLKSIGCNYVQGYFYARPMPVSEYEKLPCAAPGREDKLLKLETIQALDNNAFWNPESLETIVFNTFVGGACIFEYDGKKVEILRANDNYARVLGGDDMSVEEALKISWQDFMDEDSFARANACINRAIDTRAEQTDEMTLSNLPGAGKPTYVRSTMKVIARVGERFMFYCTLENITAQREAERKQREAAELMRTIMDNVSSGVSAAVIEDGKARLLFANDMYYSMFGYTPAQLNEELENVFLLVHPDDRRRIWDIVSRVIAEGKTCAYEYRCVKRDSSVIYVRCLTSITNMEGVAGKVLLAVITDISDRMERQQLRNQMLEHLPGGVGMYELYADGRLEEVYLNDGYYSLLGTTRDARYEYGGFDALGAVHPDDRALLTREMRTGTREGVQMSADVRILAGDGNYKWLNVRGRVAAVTREKCTLYAFYSDIDALKTLQLKLETSHDAMEIASRNSGVSFWLYDMDTRKIITGGFQDHSMMGYPDEIPNVPDSLIDTGCIHAEDAQAYRAMYAALYEDAECGECTVRVKNMNTDKFEWLHVVYTRLHDPAYKSRTAIGFSNNVDLEQELKLRYERERQLRRELIGDAIAYYQVNLTTEEVEEYLRLYAGAPPAASAASVSDELKREFMDNVPGGDAEKLRGTLMPDALWEAYTRGENSVDLIYRKRLPKQGLRWLKATASIMERPHSGDVIAFIYVKDIDAERNDMLAVAKVLEEEAEFVALARVSDNQAHFVKAGAPILRLTGARSFDFDKGFEKIMRAQAVSEDLGGCLDFFRVAALVRALKGESVARLKYRVKGLNGGVHRKQSSAMYLDDAREHIILIRRDITDLYEEEQLNKRALERAVDAANEASRAKSEFLSRMSHDIRTPLTAILALSESELINEADRARLIEHMDKIHSSGEYLLGIINDVLDMSRIESKRVSLILAPYALGDFKDTIDTVIGEQCRIKGVSFTFKMLGETLPYAMLDKVRFNQLFINILSNAVKFTPAGGSVEFMAETVNVRGDWVDKRFIVRDTGIGMSKEFLPHAFDSFAQEKRRGVTENDQGTGLGLAIVKQLVNLMGGSISVESELGEGTTFTVELSYQRAYTPVAPAPDARALDALEGLNVLLCEDHPLNAEIVAGMLNRKGCAVERAENGARGLEMFKNSPAGHYGVILMDIRMPVMNGLEAARGIRALNRPDAKTVPILALTADAFNKDAETSLDVGMNGHLAKPVEPKNLYDAIITLINK